MLRYNRCMWAGHVDRSDSWTKRCQSLEVDVRRGKGKPRKSSDFLTSKEQKTRMTGDSSFILPIFSQVQP